MGCIWSCTACQANAQQVPRKPSAVEHSTDLQRADDVVCQALLRLQPAGAQRRQPCELAEAQHDAAGWHVCDMASAMEGQQSRLAGGRKLDVPNLPTVAEAPRGQRPAARGRDARVQNGERSIDSTSLSTSHLEPVGDTVTKQDARRTSTMPLSPPVTDGSLNKASFTALQRICHQ